METVLLNSNHTVTDVPHENCKLACYKSAQVKCANVYYFYTFPAMSLQQHHFASGVDSCCTGPSFPRLRPAAPHATPMPHPA